MKHKLGKGLVCICFALGLVACSSPTKQSTVVDTDSIELSKKDEALETLGIHTGDTYTRLNETVEANGYTSNCSYKQETIDDVLTSLPQEARSEYIIKDIQTIDPQKKIISVTLEHSEHTNKSTEEALLNRRLNKCQALASVKRYGKSLYGSNFDFDLKEEPLKTTIQEENIWSFQIKAKLDDQTKTCFAKVAGNNTKPEVISFTLS